VSAFFADKIHRIFCWRRSFFPQLAFLLAYRFVLPVAARVFVCVVGLVACPMCFCESFGKYCVQFLSKTLQVSGGAVMLFICVGSMDV